MFRISGSMFWPEHPSLHLDTSHECFPTQVEGKRFSGENYLDDILLINESKQLLEENLQSVLRDLEDSGMLVNREKSTLFPSQKVKHLGFIINFEEGCLQVPQEKLKAVRRELGKIVTHTELSPRKMAAILGAVRSF